MRTVASWSSSPPHCRSSFGGALPGADDGKEKDTVLSALDARATQFLEGVSLGQSQSAFKDLLSGSQLLKQADAVEGT